MLTLPLIAVVSLLLGSITVLTPASGSPKPPAHLVGNRTVRIQAVRIRTYLFQSRKPLKTSRLKLFPDVTRDIVWDPPRSLPGGAFEWTGRVERTKAGTAALIVTGTAVTGNVNDGGRYLYEIRTAADGVIWVSEMRPFVYPD